GLVVTAAPVASGSFLVLLAAMSVLPVLQVWLSKLVVDALASSAGGDPALVGQVVVLALLYTGALVIPAGLQPLSQVLSAWLEARAVATVDRRLMEGGTRLVDLYKIEQPKFQDTLRLSHDGALFAPRLFMAVQRLIGVVTLGGLFLLLARLHIFLPLMLGALSIPQLLMERHLQNLRYTAMAKRSRPAREMDYCARMTTEPAAAKEVRVYGLGDFFLQRFRARFAVALREVSRIRLRHLRVNSLFTGAYALALAAGLWYVAAQAGAGRLTLGDVVLYVGAVTQAQAALRTFSGSVGMLYQGLLRLRAIFDFLDSAQPDIALAPSGQGRPVPAAFDSGIEMQHVGFSYPESTQPVLTAASAQLPAGKVTALAGANGAGKSTLVKLLTRMYDPGAGTILLDGVPLHEYDLESLRARIAVAYQDFAQFALTFRDNIAVGAFAAGEADGRVEQAADWAGADAIATRLPNGYATPLTRRFEGGVELSGGEWQKVALARGFVRDAALVILDEPTAALDAEAEYQLFQQFRELVCDKTALIISHRFSTVRMADHILVLEGGHIVEAGSHNHLVAQGGRYATLYEMQASRYR
ncbi:MAG: ABC transporter ATP-binding protein, partial [Dehalococcoidia bacterium]|nr:ABC transporter ATP-binding protein [Dehalococcoidia bacterium]